MKNKKTLTILIAVVAVLAIAFGVIYIVTKPGTSAGSKTVTIDVVVDGQVEKTFTEKTDAEYLGELLLDRKIAEGSTSDYGLFITTVNGRTADDANQEWWCITKSGEMVMTGADTTPIADGDHFELTLTVGYDF